MEMVERLKTFYSCKLDLKTAVLFILLIVFLRSTVCVSFTFSWSSFVTFICLAGTYIFYIINAKKKTDTCPWDSNINVFKGKTGCGYLTEEKENQVARAIMSAVVYDASNVSSIRNFNVVKKNSECIFAKRSKLWGSPDYDETISLEQNIERLVPTFYMFTMAFQDLGLDAFVIEFPGHLFGSSPQVFGKAVRTTLLTLKESDNVRRRRELLKDSEDTDPAMLKIRLNYLQEDPNVWDRNSWVFEYNRITFFITSFAPFYPSTNSRYSFGAEHCYLLFQPEISFAIHDLPPDTAETNWENPITVRDKIRVAFLNAGRAYENPLKLQEPMVYDIVKRVDPDDEVERWWKSSS